MREDPFVEAAGVGGQGDGALVLPLLRSAVIPVGFRHGFTMRGGGVSGGDFASMNLGARWGDAPANVAENRRRLQRAAGSDVVFAATQVHGAVVLPVGAGDDAAAVSQRRADGLCTALAGAVVSVYVADCIPVLMADVRTGAVAAVHAGWRGTVAGVVPAAVQRMRDEFGTRPADLRVALGPAIGVCCFEVGEEVVQAAEAVVERIPGAPTAETAGVVRRGAGKPHVDLKRLNQLLLVAAGVPPDNIDAGPECTSCDRARFFSYRRDGGRTGQMVGFIAARVG